MKKALKAVLTTVGLVAGLIALGGPTSNIATFSWFGKMTLALLVCAGAFKLLAILNATPENTTQNE